MEIKKITKNNKEYNETVGLESLRDDKPGKSLPIEEILKGAESRDRYFVVPQVVE